MRATIAGVVALASIAAVPAAAYEGGPVEGGARIDGVVRFEGDPPEQKQLEVFKHHEVCGSSVPDDSLVLGAGQSVRYAVVTLEGVARGKPIERDTLNVLDNQRCRFVPHVLAASVGQWLVLRNGDPILHNANAFDMGTHRTLFNVGLPVGKEMREPLARPGTIRVTCEVRHTWMRAFVVVAEHPYVTVTDAEGVFELRDVPPGTYELNVWHERLGSLKQSITLKKGEQHAVDLAFVPAR